MTGREIAPQEPRALAQYEHDDLDAFGQARPDELILPVRKLVQAVSREADSKHAGEFWDSLTDTYKYGLRVAILALSRSRSLFTAGDFGSAPVCVSEDAVKPRQVMVTPDGKETGPTCGECIFAQWGSARDFKGKGQECRFSYNLLCFDIEDSQVFILRVSGTSINPWRRYMTAGKMSKAPAYAVETIVSSEEEMFDAGKAYVMHFTHGESLPAGLTAAMRGLAASYRGISLGAEEAVVAPTEEYFE